MHGNSAGRAVHEVLAAVLQVRGGQLQVLLWQRAIEPDAGRWALPGGRLGDSEDVQTSVLRQLAEKVDVREVAHVEQLEVFSAPERMPGQRTVATAFLGLVPCVADPALPGDTAWHPVTGVLDGSVATAFDHGPIVRRARNRLRAKLSYTNLGFALAPPEFTVSALRELYSAALGHRVSATNLQRVLSRRGVLVSTGDTAAPGPSGGRPAALYRFAERDIRVTDPFAVLRPPELRPVELRQSEPAELLQPADPPASS
ncbi:MAG TPA: NUDIX domain-containing protein [Pseudonocardiaceae bacterium]|jgi:8-oxo-dGTP diphosphatase|nr:NUDIX domain-containing protein [Pseudonocardiaceae bacterium]